MRFLDHLYATLLGFYPRSFRAEFGAEMKAVFAEAVAEAADRGWVSLMRFLLRELRDWPASVWVAHVENLWGGENMSVQNDLLVPSTKWEAVVGTLPFLAFGVSTAMGKVAPLYAQYMEMGAYFLALTGLLLGWKRGFPLWGYSYLGWSLWVAWSNTNVRVCGGDWGYLIWIPFGVMALMALAWTRSLDPIKKLLRDVWNDWTRLSLVMFALGSWMSLIYDENHAPYLLLFILVSTLVVSGGAWLFLRSANLKGRVLPIVGSFIGVAIINGISYTTWDWHAYYGLPKSDHWYENLGVAPIGVLFWLLILLWPVIISAIRRMIRKQRVA